MHLTKKLKTHKCTMGVNLPIGDDREELSHPLFLLDRGEIFSMIYASFKHTGALRGLKGKPVQVRHGPAAVTGNETCEMPLFQLEPNGKAQGVGGSGNQKTCL
jgi:hypothetical protein